MIQCDSLDELNSSLSNLILALVFAGFDVLLRCNKLFIFSYRSMTQRHMVDTGLCPGGILAVMHAVHCGFGLCREVSFLVLLRIRLLPLVSSLFSSLHCSISFTLLLRCNTHTKGNQTREARLNYRNQRERKERET